MSDFVSTWFKYYSIYLAGERREQSSYSFENVIISVWENRFGRIIVGLFSESFFLYKLVDYNFATFLDISFFASFA